MVNNKYKYTKEIIKEYQNAWWNSEFRVGNISMVVTTFIAIGLLVQAIHNKSIGVYTVLLLLMPVLYFIMFPIRKKKAIKVEMDKYSRMYENTDNTIKIALDDKIQIKTAGGKTEVTYDRIKKYIETKNLIILLLKGDMTISLKKDSFTKGTEEECKKLLKEKIKFKNRFKRSKNV